MLHLLGRGIQPEWNEEKHDIDEVFAFLCYRGIHYAKWVTLIFSMTPIGKYIIQEERVDLSSFFVYNM